VRLDHAQLRALAAVVREGSFERAAAALSVTPSAISQRIKALEDRVGRLLVRRGSPASATTDGQVLVQLAEQIALSERDALGRIGIAGDEMAPSSLPIAVNHDSLETWFVEAAILFAAKGVTTLDLYSEDQDHTATLLRQGQVLGAITAGSEPVQGCRLYPLGSMRYAASCTPEFRDRYFADGVNARSLARAPVLVFNRKDALQARFARKMGADQNWHPPIWWMPSTRAFVHATLAGLGWTMNPLPLVEPALKDGRLVMLRARVWEDVPLFWQHWRVDSIAMSQLTDSILAASSTLIRRRAAS
jgi:LysR family transcriptional regulator (chromosome initiation inhibitor)